MFKFVLRKITLLIGLKNFAKYIIIKRATNVWISLLRKKEFGSMQFCKEIYGSVGFQWVFLICETKL